MATISVREFVTKLSTKADLSGVKGYLAGLKRTTKAAIANSRRVRQESQKESKYQTSKAVESMKAKVALMHQTAQAQKDINKQSLKATIQTHRAEMRLLRAKNKEKLNLLRQEARARRQSSKGGFKLPSMGGGGVGLGSIISGNVIATGITNALSRAKSMVTGFATGMIDAAASIEKVRAEFGVMLGDISMGNKLIAELKQKGAETPLQFRDLAQQARTLLQYGSSAEKVTEELTMIGDVVGGDAERFKFMSFAFAQMKSAGKLMGQELRQMVNAGFNPLDQMAKRTGLTMNQLRKEMEMGTISSEMVVQAFKDATSQGGRFYKNMEVQSKTFTGRMSTMRDEVFMLMEAMGAELLPAAKKGLNGLIAFIKGDGRKIGINLMKSMLPAINAVVQGFERFGRTLFDVKGILSDLKDKDKTGSFFKDLAKKIDEAFIFITASALQLKEFLSKNWDSIVKGFVLIVWGIKQMLKYLPELITLWAGLKLAGIASSILGIATAVATLASKLGLIALTNPALMLTLASLVAIAHAFNKSYTLQKKMSMQKEVDALLAKAKDRLELAKEVADEETEITKQLQNQNLEAAKKKRLEDALAMVRDRKESLKKEGMELNAQAVAKSTEMTGTKTVLEDVKGIFSSFKSGVPTPGSADSFQKAMDKAFNVQTTFNINVNTENKTEINNTNAGADVEEMAENNIGRMFKSQSNAAFDGVSRALRSASVR